MQLFIYIFSTMEHIFEKFKNFLLPAFILLQLIIVVAKKILDKKREGNKREKWKEYAERLGLALKETAEGKQPYLSFALSSHPAYLIEWSIPGGIKEGLALLIAIGSIRIDKNFSLQKKFKFQMQKQSNGNIGLRMLNIEEEYYIKGEDESFKRKLLNSRAITHILSTKPESLSFFAKEDVRSVPVPEKVETDSFLLIITKLPDDYNKLNELIEMGRTIMRTLDTF